MSFKSCPPMVIAPLFTSQKPAMSFAIVDLPLPEGPTSAVMLLRGTERLTEWSISALS